jgi:hypothetical protein
VVEHRRRAGVMRRSPHFYSSGQHDRDNKTNDPLVMRSEIVDGDVRCGGSPMSLIVIQKNEAARRVVFIGRTLPPEVRNSSNDVPYGFMLSGHLGASVRAPRFGGTSTMAPDRSRCSVVHRTMTGLHRNMTAFRFRSPIPRQLPPSRRSPILRELKDPAAPRRGSSSGERTSPTYREMDHATIRRIF